MNLNLNLNLSHHMMANADNMITISCFLPKKNFPQWEIYWSSFYTKCYTSLRSRRLEVAGKRENGRTRERHARGEGAPARKAPENRFNSHSMSADISNWSRGSRGKN